MSCCPKPEPPGLLQKAGTLARAIVRETGARLRGDALRMDEVLARKAVCETCPDYNGKTCALCGCIIAAKTVFATEDCPARKWPHRVPRDTPPEV